LQDIRVKSRETTHVMDEMTSASFMSELGNTKETCGDQDNMNLRGSALRPGRVLLGRAFSDFPRWAFRNLMAKIDITNPNSRNAREMRGFSIL
jgi:hypothetical protein